VAALSEQLRRERADLARGSHARRFEMVSLVLDSAPVTTGRASTGLGYDLRRRHTAAVLWTDPRRPDQGALAAAAEALGPATRARQVLSEGREGRGPVPQARGRVTGHGQARIRAPAAPACYRYGPGGAE